MISKLIDTHCHLDFVDFDSDRDEVIKRALSSGVECLINIGSSVQGSIRSVELAKKYSMVYAAVGIHPHEADRVNENDISIIAELAKKDKIAAIGEIGLDYYKNYSQQLNQKKLFISLLGLNRKINLPVVIHTRQAQDDTLGIIKDFIPIKAAVHCFSGDDIFLKACLDLGFFISFTCNITYKKSDNLRNIVKLAPLDRIMLETDAPYLSPEGFRGRRNEPFNVKFLAERIAQIKGIDVGEAAFATTANAKRFFRLKEE